MPTAHYVAETLRHGVATAPLIARPDKPRPRMSVDRAVDERQPVSAHTILASRPNRSAAVTGGCPIRDSASYGLPIGDTP